MSNRDIGAFHNSGVDIGAFQSPVPATTHQITATASIVLTATGSVTQTHQVTSTAAIVLTATGAVALGVWRKIAIEGLDATFTTVTLAKTSGNGVKVDTDGNWRIDISGEFLLIEKRIAGTWTELHKFGE